jgi:FkbM family methyltransferase
MLEEFYKQFVSPEDLVFDIGANVGSRSRAFLNIGARVVAVEPDPRCHLELREIPNLKIAEVAAGEDGVLGKLRFGQSSCASTLSGKWIDAVTKTDRFSGLEWTAELPVIQYSLDHFIQIYGVPDFIKIDVEGYEAEVLRGLSVPVKALSFEFTPEILDSAEACVRKAGSLGMLEFAYSLEETLELSNWTDGDTILAQLGNLDSKVYGDVYSRLPILNS